MNKLFQDDIYASMFCKLIAASLPFITVGMLGSTVIMYISSVIGAVALVGLVARIFSKTKTVEQTAISRDIDDLLQLPYAFALCYAIAALQGVEEPSVLWMAVALAIIVIIPNHIKR